MIALIAVIVMLIGMMCVLAYTLAIYALPFMLALAAMRFAYGTGAGWIGAGIVGIVAGVASFGILTLLFAMLRAPILRVALASPIRHACRRGGICARAWRHRRGRSTAGVAANRLPRRGRMCRRGRRDTVANIR